MSSGGGGNTTTVQKSDPWAGQQGYLTDVMQRAQQLYNKGGAQYFPGSTVAGQSDATQLAQNLTAARALTGSPINSSAGNLLTGTLQGDYLNPQNNPGFKLALDDAAKAYASGTAARTDAAAQMNRSYGGSAYNEVKDRQDRQFADSLTKMTGDMYDQERTRQMQGLMFAPQMANQDYTDLAALANVGGGQDARAQDLLNANIARWDYNQNLPAMNLAQYMNFVNGNYGGTSSSQTKSGGSAAGSALTGALGGGMAGYALGPALGLAGPYGIALGAGMGLLGGLL